MKQLSCWKQKRICVKFENHHLYLCVSKKAVSSHTHLFVPLQYQEIKEDFDFWNEHWSFAFTLKQFWSVLPSSKFWMKFIFVNSFQKTNFKKNWDSFSLLSFCLAIWPGRSKQMQFELLQWHKKSGWSSEKEKQRIQKASFSVDNNEKFLLEFSFSERPLLTSLSVWSFVAFGHHRNKHPVFCVGSSAMTKCLQRSENSKAGSKKLLLFVTQVSFNVPFSCKNEFPAVALD